MKPTGSNQKGRWLTAAISAETSRRQELDIVRDGESSSSSGAADAGPRWAGSGAEPRGGVRPACTPLPAPRVRPLLQALRGVHRVLKDVGIEAECP